MEMLLLLLLARILIPSSYLQIVFDFSVRTLIPIQLVDIKVYEHNRSTSPLIYVGCSRIPENQQFCALAL